VTGAANFLPHGFAYQEVYYGDFVSAPWNNRERENDEARAAYYSLLGRVRLRSDSAAVFGGIGP
jgi:hypothetical protein